MGFIPENTKGKKPIGLIACAILIPLLVIGGLAYFLRGRSIDQQVARAESYVQEGKYDLAKEEYASLYAKTNDEEYRQKRDAMSSFDAYNRLISEAENFVRGGNFRGALASYKKIPEDAAQVYALAQKRIDGVVESVVSELQGYNTRGEFDTTLSATESYLKLLPNREEFLKLQKEALEGKEKKNQEILQQKEEEIAKEKQKSKSISDVPRKALIGTMQVVRTKSANIRSGPGFKYGIVGELFEGDSVYVYNATTRDGRTWVDVGDGWMSYKTLNGEL